ncbi:hypothetical protein AB0892_28980 [Streptomyces sp. NPDC005409]|uniref:hypothetical protein n=1 Tax=Streptomyces sp. NPDC005409 TaxID=3155342 RepID=UPI003455EB83
MEIRFEGGVVAESVPGQLGSVPRFSVGGRFVVVSPYGDRLAPDFDLVAAADGTYAGWILENPADCVVDGFEDRRPDAATDAFRERLAEFLDLFVEPRIDAMQDEDPALLVRLEALLTRVSALPPDPRHDAMRRWMLQVREDWYGIPAVGSHVRRRASWDV